MPAAEVSMQQLSQRYGRSVQLTCLIVTVHQIKSLARCLGTGTNSKFSNRVDLGSITYITTQQTDLSSSIQLYLHPSNPCVKRPLSHLALLATEP